MAATFLQAAVNATLNQSSYTFTSQNIGTAASDRIITALVKMSGAAGSVFGTITIGGITATVIQSQGGATGVCSAAIATAAVPTGTTATVVVNITGGLGFECGIGLYSSNNTNTTAFNSAGSGIQAAATNPAPSVSINIPSTGHTLGVAATQNDAAVTSFTWTNLTRDYQAVVRSNAWHSGASGTPAQQNSLAITATLATGGAVNYVLLAASFASNAAGGGTGGLLNLMGVGT